MYIDVNEIIDIAPADMDMAEYVIADRFELRDSDVTDDYCRKMMDFLGVEVKLNTRFMTKYIKLPDWTDYDYFEDDDLKTLANLISAKCFVYTKKGEDISAKVPTDTRVKNLLAPLWKYYGYDPLVDYFDSLRDTWDGKKRLETHLKDCLRTTTLNDYHNELSQKMILSLVMKQYRPNINFPYNVVIIGDQGKGKSSYSSYLLPLEKNGDYNECYQDSLDFSLKGKDFTEAREGMAVCEIQEMTGASKTDVSNIKSKSSTKAARMRRAYGRNTQKIPYKDIIFCTVNDAGEGTIPPDPTGYRRWAPVYAGLVTPQEIGRYWKYNREQLYAEALIEADKIINDNQGVPIFMNLSEEQNIERETLAQSNSFNMYQEIDSWIESRIQKSGNKTISVMEDIIPADNEDGYSAYKKMNSPSARMIGLRLRDLGYVKKRIGTAWVWYPK